MCVERYVSCEVRWYVCVGVPPSSVSFLRDYMDRTTQHCVEHRDLQA